MFSDGTKQIFKNKLYDVYRVKTKLYKKENVSHGCIGNQMRTEPQHKNLVKLGHYYLLFA